MLASLCPLRERLPSIVVFHLCGQKYCHGEHNARTYFLPRAASLGGAQPIEYGFVQIPPEVSLFQRFEFNDTRSEIIAYPEGRRVGCIIDIHATYVGGARQEIVGRFARFCIHARDVVV